VFNDRFQKQPTVSAQEVQDIQERVRSMRRQIGRRGVQLADLFALLGEQERPVPPEAQEARRPEVARVWPDQGPSLQPVLQLATGEPGGANRLVKPDPDSARLVVGAGRSRLEQ
jgi:hypothetical protein